jgi:hypothetical protein
MRSLAKDPDARFQSADDFTRALPDLPAPNAAAPRPSTPETVAPDPSPPVKGNPVATCEPGGTMAFEYVSSTERVSHDSMTFDYSAATLRQELPPRRSAPPPPAPASPPLAAASAPAGTPIAARPSANSTPSSRPPPPAAHVPRGAQSGFRQFVRGHRALTVAVLGAALVLGTLGRHAKPPDVVVSATSVAPSSPPLPQAPTAAQTPKSTEAAMPPSAVPSSASEPAPSPPAEVAAPIVVPASAATLATTTPAARQDLSGTWRGEYVDASGRQLLRVVSLSISRIRDDGGIEGTLQYAATSGEGECELHPRGSTYSAGEQHLQLSPEGCSPHYPRELGVPLDFEGVNPQANTLANGRIEAPTGAVIRVRLKRVSGA